MLLQFYFVVLHLLVDSADSFQLSNSLKSRQNFFEKKSNSRVLKRLLWRIVIIPFNSKISILNPIGYPIGLHLSLNHTLIEHQLRPNWASIALRLGLNCKPTFAPKKCYCWLSTSYKVSHFRDICDHLPLRSQKSSFFVLKNRRYIRFFLQ